MYIKKRLILNCLQVTSCTCKRLILAFPGLYIFIFTFFFVPFIVQPYEDSIIYNADFYTYTAMWTDARFNEILRGRTKMKSSYLTSVGLRYPLGNVLSHLSKEVEMNYTHHFGRQWHPEINAAFNLRWNRFPWNQYLPTSIAYGIGPSLAFSRPHIEDDDKPSYYLLFMVAEIAVELPGAWNKYNMEGLIRVHHRSGVFGYVSDASGSNFIALGIRFPLGNIFNRSNQSSSSAAFQGSRSKITGPGLSDYTLPVPSSPHSF